eukprot:scaffold177_cov334-Pavlova_lutheri.AAC.59
MHLSCVHRTVGTSATSIFLPSEVSNNTIVTLCLVEDPWVLGSSSPRFHPTCPENPHPERRTKRREKEAHPNSHLDPPHPDGHVSAPGRVETRSIRSIPIDPRIGSIRARRGRGGGKRMPSDRWDTDRMDLDRPGLGASCGWVGGSNGGRRCQLSLQFPLPEGPPSPTAGCPHPIDPPHDGRMSPRLYVSQPPSLFPEAGGATPPPSPTRSFGPTGEGPEGCGTPSRSTSSPDAIQHERAKFEPHTARPSDPSPNRTEGTGAVLPRGTRPRPSQGKKTERSIGSKGGKKTCPQARDRTGTIPRQPPSYRRARRRNGASTDRPAWRKERETNQIRCTAPRGRRARDQKG